MARPTSGKIVTHAHGNLTISVLRPPDTWKSFTGDAFGNFGFWSNERGFKLFEIHYDGVIEFFVVDNSIPNRNLPLLVHIRDVSHRKTHPTEVKGQLCDVFLPR